MKKIGALLLFAAMTLSMAACGKKESNMIDNTVVESGSDADSGSISVKLAEPIELPEGAKDAYESAIAEYTDQEYETLGYLGSQVVSGTNYKFLVREAANEDVALGKTYVLVVYQNLEGKAEVTEMTQVNCFDYYDETKKFAPETLMGGWNVNDAYGAGLAAVCQEDYEKAAADYKDYELEPICMIDFALSDSVTYFILCKAMNEDASGLCVVTVERGLVSGESQISCVNAFE